MKEHTPITELFWQRELEKQKQNPITQGDYEEWRNHPCTQRLQRDLEEIILSDGAQLTTLLSGESEDIFSAQRVVAGKAQVIEFVFAWAPDEISLEVDDES